MLRKLEGKVAVVTGASNGIGAAIAKALAERRRGGGRESCVQQAGHRPRGGGEYRRWGQGDHRTGRRLEAGAQAVRPQRPRPLADDEGSRRAHGPLRAAASSTSAREGAPCARQIRASTPRRRWRSTRSPACWRKSSAQILLRFDAEPPDVDQVLRLPAVDVVLGHAALGELLPAIVLPRGQGTEQRVAPDLLVAARVVDLVELVAAAELAADRVPQELHELD